MFVSDLFKKNSPGKLLPQNWEHAHNHVIMTYRMYYNGDILDPTFPEPVPPREIIVPKEKPRELGAAAPFYVQMTHSKPKSIGPTGPRSVDGDHDHDNLDVAEILGEKKDPAEERRRVLAEVRDHLDILKEFEGSISKEDLIKRKRELFAALPSAPPPPLPSKKQKTAHMAI
jgi:hypothetical protein